MTGNSTTAKATSLTSILQRASPCEFPTKLKITFQIQKNMKNGQSITLAANNVHPDICPVRAAYRIFLRAKRLGQSDSEPMALFVNKFVITRYLTGSKIAEVL
jgi:hypothetical protein